MIKRLTFLIISTCLALFLSACGDNAEKKVETKSQQEMEQPKADSTESTSVVTPDENVSSNEDASPASDANVSQAATESANQTAAAESTTPSDRTASSESSEIENSEQPA